MSGKIGGAQHSLFPAVHCLFPFPSLVTTSLVLSPLLRFGTSERVTREGDVTDIHRAERDKETRDVGGCRSLVTLVLCSHLTSFPHPRHLPGFAGVRRTGDEEGGVKSEMWGKGCEGTG